MDLSGNLFEWTADWYGKYPDERQVDPRGPNSGTTRVMKGGSWIYYFGVESLRAPARHQGDMVSLSWNYGFRCARSY
jgi:formylglycine-generating enzyme required for sulfatase activity